MLMSEGAAQAATEDGGESSGGRRYRGAEIYTTTSDRYGRIEFRMRAARGSGVLSNFFVWKEGSEAPGGAWEEVDIEIFGRDDARSYQSNIITGTASATIMSEQEHGFDFSFADSYHTFALEWTPGEIRWYVDGVLNRRTTGGQAADIASPAQFRFNTWVAENAAWVGPFDDAILPVHLYVNWVKYYRYHDGDFELEWHDTFNRSDTLRSRWALADWTFDNNLVQFTPANATLSNGKLVLSITHADRTGFSGVAPDDPADGDDQP